MHAYILEGYCLLPYDIDEYSSCTTYVQTDRHNNRCRQIWGHILVGIGRQYRKALYVRVFFRSCLASRKKFKHLACSLNPTNQNWPLEIRSNWETYRKNLKDGLFLRRNFEDPILVGRESPSHIDWYYKFSGSFVCSICLHACMHTCTRTSAYVTVAAVAVLVVTVSCKIGGNLKVWGSQSLRDAQIVQL